MLSTRLPWTTSTRSISLSVRTPNAVWGFSREDSVSRLIMRISSRWNRGFAPAHVPTAPVGIQQDLRVYVMVGTSPSFTRYEVRRTALCAYGAVHHFILRGTILTEAGENGRGDLSSPEQIWRDCCFRAAEAGANMRISVSCTAFVFSQDSVSVLSIA